MNSRSLEEWGRILVEYAKGYIITRNSSLEVYKNMRPQAAGDDAAARTELDEAVALGRSEFEGFLSETWEAFQASHKDEGLCGSYFDLMTEVRETPENAENSLRDFLARSQSFM
ncbi:MAG: hypothetical protein IJM08_05285 [Firmicutes bacterium]|nr:hypothetical protein [Bacillota bacterium]